MQQESRFFRTLFDEAPLPYHSLDSEGRLLNVNHAWQHELGYQKHEVLGRWFGDFVSSSQREQFREQFRYFVEQGSVRGIVWQLLRRDGRPLDASFNSLVIRDENGRFLRTQCIFFDLNERSEGEQQLRQSEELRMAFMESATDGLALFDSQLRIVYVNPAATLLLGADSEELIGKKITEIFPETDQPDHYAVFRHVLKTGKSQSIDDLAWPAQLGDRWLAVHIFKVGDNLGVVLRDVTDANMSEQRLLESEARWRAMTESNPDHVLLLDHDLNIEYINRALPGLIGDQAMGAALHECVNEAYRETVRQALQSVLDSGEPSQFETQHLGPDGVMVSYQSHVVPRMLASDIVGLFVFSHDITRSRADADRVDRLLERQTAIASLAVDFGRTNSLQDIYRTVYRHVRAVMQADMFIIWHFHAVRQLITASYVVTDGNEQDIDTQQPVELEPQSEGTSSQVIVTGEPIIIADCHAAAANTSNGNPAWWTEREGMEPNQENDVSANPGSMLLVPMKIRDQVIGVMQLQSNKPGAYQPKDIELLSGLADITAVAIASGNSLKNSKTTYQGVIGALAKAVELRDPYANRHQQGVARVAVKIAARLALPEDQVSAIELSAHIHDIGKVIVPAEILSKPSRLTDAQMSIVRSHVEATHEIINDIAFPWPIDEIVIQHHERMDGSGYPNGIKGDDIRLEARILAVADIVDAMRSQRSYRPAFGWQETIAELRRLRGKSLDADVVDACLAMLKQDDAQ